MFSGKLWFAPYCKPSVFTLMMNVPLDCRIWPWYVYPLQYILEVLCWLDVVKKFLFLNNSVVIQDLWCFRSCHWSPFWECIEFFILLLLMFLLHFCSFIFVFFELMASWTSIDSSLEVTLRAPLKSNKMNVQHWN